MARIAVAAVFTAVLSLSSTSMVGAEEFTPFEVIERSISGIAARRMVDTCLDLADARGWRMQVTVADRSGALVAFGRSDNATAGSQDISLIKARTAAQFGWSTEEFAQYAWPVGDRSPGPLAFAPGMIGVAGGLPIFTPEGDHIGGIGVSGALPAHDVECAKAAIEKVGTRHDR